MESLIEQQKTVTARIIMRTVAPVGVAGYGPAVFNMPSSDIPFSPDMITIDNIALTTTSALSSQTFLLRSSIVDDDILFSFPGSSAVYAPQLKIRLNKPLNGIRFTVTRQDATGETSIRDGAGLTGSWFLTVTMNFIQLKRKLSEVQPLESRILQHRVIPCRMVLRNAAANSYQGCILNIPNSQIPYQPDLIRIDSISLQTTGTTVANHWLLRSNIVNNDILFAFTGSSFNIFPGTIIKPTRPINSIQMAVTYWGLIGGTNLPVTEQQPNTGTGMSAINILIVQLSFFQLG